VLVASIVVAGARYLVGGLAGSPVFSTQVRVHLGVLAGLILMAIAVGYQLDKFELVYSTRGVATGVSYTDAHAQFLAYDVLTGLSAIAAAFLVGGAFTRVMWPLALTIAVWFIASIGIGRIYPEIVQAISVKPNEQTLEAPYISNNIAMTRLAFDLDGWDVRDYRGEAPLTEAAIQQHENTFLNARLWDYRPLGDTLDQLQTVRQYYDFFDVDTDRYQLGDKVRQVMLSVREFNTTRNPNPTWINDHLYYTHGIGIAMVPVNEVTPQGQPRLVIRDMPPVSSSGAPDISQPRVYFGELPSQYVVVDSNTAEFDFPRGSEGSGVDATTSWNGANGIKLDTVLSRLLFSLRFRDFNLLISDQITNQSQLLFHRSLDDRLPRIAPFLRYDKDPYVVVDCQGQAVLHPGRLHRVGSIPQRPGLQPRRAGRDRPGRRRHQLPAEQRQGRHGRLRRHDELLRQRPRRSADPGLAGRLPDALQADVAVPRGSPAAPPRARGAVQRRDPDVRPLPRHEPPDVLRRERCLDGSDRPVERREPPERGVLRDHVAARGEQPRVPPPPADDPPRAAEHDRLGRGADGRRRLRPDARLSLPRRDQRLRAPADRGPDLVRPDHQLAVHALEPVREQGDPGQPDRRTGR
jgi:hypothetical protein